MSVEPTTRTLELPDARIVYDVRGPLPTSDGRPVLLMIGQPMDASGFTALASYFADRTVVTYDPRGLGRSTRSDGRTRQRPRAARRRPARADRGAGQPPDRSRSSAAAAARSTDSRSSRPTPRTWPSWWPTSRRSPTCCPTRRWSGGPSRPTSRPTRRAGSAPAWPASSPSPPGRGRSPRSSSPRPPPTPRCSGCPPRTTAAATTRCSRVTRRGVVAFTPDPETLRATGTRIVVAAGEESARQVTGRCAAAVAAAARRTARDLPQPPRWLPRRGLGMGRRARGVRRQAARGAHRLTLGSGRALS